MLNQYDFYFIDTSGLLKAHVWKGTPEASPYYASVWRLKPDGGRGQFLRNLAGRTTSKEAEDQAAQFMDDWVAAYLIKHPPKKA